MHETKQWLHPLRIDWLMLPIILLLIIGTPFYSASSASAQSTSASVTDCSTFGSVGEAGTLADALATNNIINFECTGTIIVPEILTPPDLTINGQEGVILSGGDANRVFFVPNNVQVSLNNLVIEGGDSFDENAANIGSGGNIYNAGTLVLNSTEVRQNTIGTILGGGIYNSGLLLLTNVLFNNNDAETSGGGIYNVGQVEATNLTMRNHRAEDAPAIHNDGNALITNCLIENMFSNASWAIMNSGDLIVNDCLIREVDGAILNVDMGTLFMNRTTIDSADGSLQSPIDNDEPATMFLSSVTISNSSGESGAIYSRGRAVIENSTFSGNVGSEAGAVQNIGTMEIKNSTITNNRVGAFPVEAAGGILNSGALTMWDTIVADQAAGPDCGGETLITSNGYNLDSDGTCNLNAAGDIRNGYAYLEPLADNGGPTLTHALLVGPEGIDSEALNNGNCSNGIINLDQRGVERPQRGACDIGAFEVMDESTSPERDILIALYNSTDGDNWIDNTNWLEGDICTWHGVFCDDGGSVIGINLSVNELNGTLPPELGELQDLTFLLLHENQLSGGIPSELGNLVRLGDLYLGDNPLGGEIPQELGNLVNMQFIFLGNAQLSGPIPAEIGDMTSLVTLILSGNELSGAVPAEVGNLMQLADLYLNDNQLSGPLPIELGNLTNLSFLTLDANAADFCMPLTLQDFVSQIQFLYEPPPGGFCAQEAIAEQERNALIALYNSTNGDNWINNTNWLEGDHCTWFGVLCQNSLVTELTVSGNQLTGSIPPELGNLSNVVVLELFENPLSGSIPPEMGNMSSIELLFMQDTQLSGPIPPELGSLPNLAMLSLRNNQHSGPIPKELGQPTNLFFLDLGNNQLSGELPGELANLPVEFLDLENNNLTGIIPPTFGNLDNLIALDLSKNQLSGTIPETLGNIDSLAGLILSFNQLSGEVPLSLGNLFNLQTLSLNDNDPELCTPSALQNFVGNLEEYNPPPGGFCEETKPPTGLDIIEIEAESGMLYGGFTILEDTNASGGAYIRTTGNTFNRGTTLDPEQRVEYTFTVAEDGIYRFAGIVGAPTVMQNSFYVQIDGIPSQGYTWHNEVGEGYHLEYITDGPNIDIVERVLTAGEHTLTVYLREARTRLDKLIIERVSDVLVEPKPEGCDGLVREAEAGDWEGMFTVGEDKNASNGFYIHVPEGSGSRGELPDAMQKASYCFTVEDPGTYRVKAWASADNIFNNSFFVTVNDDTAANVDIYDHTWHLTVNADYASAYVTYQTIDPNNPDAFPFAYIYPTVEVELEAGVHTVYFFLREDGTRLDKVALEPINMTHKRMRRHATMWPDGTPTFLPFMDR